MAVVGVIEASDDQTVVSGKTPIVLSSGLS